MSIMPAGKLNKFWRKYKVDDWYNQVQRDSENLKKMFREQWGQYRCDVAWRGRETEPLQFICRRHWDRLSLKEKEEVYNKYKDTL